MGVKGEKVGDLRGHSTVSASDAGEEMKVRRGTRNRDSLTDFCDEGGCEAVVTNTGSQSSCKTV